MDKIKKLNIRHNTRRHAPLTAVGACLLLLLTALMPSLAQNKVVPPIKPIIPTADRNQPGKVFLEKADSLVMNERVSTDYMTLYGNVMFRKGGMFMYCDSAHFYEKSNSLDAFGNVRMEQGDTLFVYGDELNYNGMTEQAVLYGGTGRKARLINRDVKLETDIFHYDMKASVGYYDVGGKLSDKLNTLTSVEGYYYPNTKDAFFYYNVHLFSPRQNDTLQMFTDSLTYNTATNVAQLIARTRIINRDGTILSSSGDYNTRTGVADLYSRSTVITNKGNTLTGDTLFYDRQSGIGEAFGNMILTDTVNKADLFGDYGYYNETRDSAFVTGNALAKEYSKKDTLYLHGDTINAYRDFIDSTRVTNAFHRVRFYRVDVQGLCDSLSLTERDSILHMYDHPMIWSDQRQIYGNVIDIHLNDSTVDRARLPEFGIMGEHVAEDCFNQLAGNDMTAWFCDSTITRLYVEGNVQVIMFPMENDSTYNKYAFAESSFLDAYFTEGEIDHVKMWPETTGNVVPLYLAKRSAYSLPQFKWYGDELRPMAPDEVMDYPPGMDALFSSPSPGTRRKRGAAPQAQPVTPPAEAAPEAPETPETPEAPEAPEAEE